MNTTSQLYPLPSRRGTEGATPIGESRPQSRPRAAEEAESLGAQPGLLDALLPPAPAWAATFRDSHVPEEP